MALAAFVINRTRVPHLAGFRRRCHVAAAAVGAESLLLETTEAERGAGLADAAIAEGAGLVIAAGGDGTVRACAHALAGTRVPLAIVPLGTANLAARALGVPTALGPALATAFGTCERRIDVAVADGMTFIAMAGMGVDAAVVDATPRLLKERFGWLAYAVTGIVHLPGRSAGFTVRMDGGEPLTRNARSVVVGNTGLLPGGFTLLPRARFDDGVLDVGILAPADAFGWLRVAHRVSVSSSYDDRHLERFRARRVDICADTQLPREADGEVIAPGASLTVTVRPAALTVRVPPRPSSVQAATPVRRHTAVPAGRVSGGGGRTRPASGHWGAWAYAPAHPRPR